jgi:hypothetical protein
MGPYPANAHIRLRMPLVARLFTGSLGQVNPLHSGGSQLKDNASWEVGSRAGANDDHGCGVRRCGFPRSATRALAVPILKLEILQLRNVKTKHFCLGLEADIRSISFDVA